MMEHGSTGDLKARVAEVSNELKAQQATLRATIQVTRKATGKVETYELTGTAVHDEPQPKEPTCQ